MQSQSHLQEKIRKSLDLLLKPGQLTGLTCKENKILVSTYIPSTEFEAIRINIENLIQEINSDFEVTIFNEAKKQVTGNKSILPKIKHIIAVASGKGGVGKSTIAVNLAFALSKIGQKVALVDTDIYGPSIPHMLGITEKPTSPDGKKMSPICIHDVECISMGMVMPKDQPAIWRGPMVMKAVRQLMSEVHWSDRDIMVLDLPPGTGDAQLTLVQNYQISGAVIVSTPQDLALIDAIKAIAMFQRVDVPILGLVENMSTFSCPHCGEQSDIFHHGGVKEQAKAMGLDFLDSIALSPDLRLACDSEKPFVLEKPDHEITKNFIQSAQRVVEKLNASSSHFENDELQRVG